MVFGLFSKKEEIKKPELKRPKPPGGAASSAVSGADKKAPSLDNKIDLLEAEMTLDFTAATSGTPGKPAPKSDRPAVEGGAIVDTGKPPNSVLGVPSNSQDGLNTSLRSIMNMEVSSSPFEKAPVIEEAAILYANGDDEGAIAALKAAIAANNLPRGVAPQVWLLLFDVYQLTGRRAEFDNLSMEYTVRFELSPPGWPTEESVTDAALAQIGGSHFAFTGNLDNDSTKQFQALQKIAQKTKYVRIDFSKIDTVAPEGCQMLWKSFAAFRRAGHDVVLSGAPHLVGKLLSQIETGRNTDPQVYWLLLLDLYQYQVLQPEFEEAALNYCITYEVSPPAWEEPKKVTTKKVIDLNKTIPPGTPDAMRGAETVSIDMMHLEGELLNGADRTLAAMREFSKQRPYPAFDVGRLKRVDFTTAGALLNFVTEVHNGDAHAEIRNCGHVIGALFAILGFQNHARLTKKK